MAGYVRVYNETGGEIIEAADFVNEYESISGAFDASTGHAHDGSVGEGAYIGLLSDSGNLNEVLVDSINDKIIFSVDVGSVKTAQIEVIDGALVPTTTNDVDLGSVTNQIKDIHAAGNANLSVLALTSGISVSAIYDEDNMASDSAVALASQQSIKAYADAGITSHTHDGVDSNLLTMIASADGYNVAEIDDLNNQVVFSVDVASVKTNKAAIDSAAIFPTTNLDIDLGKSANRFNLAYISQLDIGGSTAVNSILDEDNMATDSATALATQQSIKAYVDANTTSGIAHFIAEGSTPTTSPVATGTDSIAIGDGASSTGNYGISIGYDTNADNIDSISMGRSNICGDYSVSIGTIAEANPDFSVAIGYNAVCDGTLGTSTNQRSIAIGEFAYTNAAGVVAVGYSAEGHATQTTVYGYTANAREDGGIAIGTGAQAGVTDGGSTITNSLAIGVNAKAIHVDSVAIGHNAQTGSDGQISFGSGVANRTGSTYLPYATTTTATPTVMTNTPALSDNEYMTFKGIIVGKRTDATNEGAAYKIEGLIKRDSGVASTAIIGSATVTTLAESDASWDLTVAANTTNGTLDITVTGAASKNITWVGKIEAVNVI